MSNGGDCTHSAIPGCQPVQCTEGSVCDDFSACTTDECSGSAGSPGFCNNTPVNCDDGNTCTVDSCSAGFGCVNASVPGTCDDGDPCTQGDYCLAGVCTAGNDVCTVPDFVACKLSGSANSEVVCPLRLASLVNTPAKFASGLQCTVSFDETKVELLAFEDEVCFGGSGCFDLPVAGAPAAQPLSTGHSVSVAPTTVAAWNTDGFGGMVIVNLNDPTKAISSATIGAGNAVVGDPVVLRMRFKLLSGVAPASAVSVYLDKIVAADGSSLPLAIAPISKALAIVVTSP
jgi:hypothetical protein